MALVGNTIGIPCSTSHSGLPPPTCRTDTLLFPLADAVEFDDVGSFFAVPNASTVTFPPSDWIPSAKNGTRTTELTACLRSPKRTGERLHNAVNKKVRRVKSLEWKSVRGKVNEIKDVVSQEVSSKLNAAFEGRDAPEMLNFLNSKLPNLNMPTRNDFDRAVDILGDAVQKLLEQFPVKTALSGTESEGSQWQFAWVMGRKARQALVRQTICDERYVFPQRENMAWQVALNQALVSFPPSSCVST